MAKKLSLEVANFICRFGDQAVMMDLFNEVVRPAFLHERERTYGETTYTFIDTSIELFEEGNLNSAAIVGRIVKDTILRREQVFDSKNRHLIKQKSKMATAPSSVFVLLLASHRLLYVREQSDSPGFGAFRTTCERFLRKAHLEYINSLYDDLQKGADGKTKKELRELWPLPDVQVVPIVSPESIEEFVRRFKILKVAEFTVLSTNSENNNNAFLIDEIRRVKEELESEKTSISHRNSDGLNKQQVTAQIEAARDGNTSFRLQGVDSHGNKLIGDNHEFNLRHPIPDLSESTGAASREMFEQSKEVGSAIIGIKKKLTADMTKKIEDVLNKNE